MFSRAEFKIPPGCGLHQFYSMFEFNLEITKCMYMEYEISFALTRSSIEDICQSRLHKMFATKFAASCTGNVPV